MQGMSWYGPGAVRVLNNNSRSLNHLRCLSQFQGNLSGQVGYVRKQSATKVQAGLGAGSRSRRGRGASRS